MANFMKRGDKWQARISWRDNNGKLHQKSKSGFATKQEARQYAIRLESQKEDGVLLDKEVSFKDYFQEWFKTYKQGTVSDNTARHYHLTGKLITKYFEQASLKNIKRTDFQKFINWYGANHAPESVRKVKTICRACIRSAIIDGLIIKDFTADVELVANKNNITDVEYLSLKQLSKLTNCLIKHRQTDKPTIYMILTGIYTGARLSEVQALTWNDLDLAHKTIKISKAWDNLHGGGFTSTKNESSKRTIRVNQELLSLLMELKVNGNTLIFEEDSHKIPGSYQVNRDLRKFLLTIGLKNTSYHFHSLRHSHVAYLLSQGIDLYAISKRLGHSNMTITGKVYAYLIDEYKARMDDEIEKKLGKIRA
ncbi:tyrosine-type recombinase/integrase [Lactobacillus sp. 3B(2020)]|uniref:site-specific integrase n=1 Tax=Lactobacillus sp. 3B(2020) TaxID=2695882 RepID=UPI0015DEB29F|nr:tyrosine-type recombinase/integrase [Lactobacillus sp. 3B(2020)]QLL69553.1 tyrosine-type recombinase/integrase [Lactobacillus sp. 3B(2020)]